MTTLYKPVKIESAEQAEALPDGSMAYLDDADAYGKPSRSVASKHRGAWWVDDRRDSVVGWTALVPIEAEEETREHPYRDEDDPDSPYLRPIQQTRYVTPWEAV